MPPIPYTRGGRPGEAGPGMAAKEHALMAERDKMMTDMKH